VLSRTCGGREASNRGARSVHAGTILPEGAEARADGRPAAMSHATDALTYSLSLYIYIISMSSAADAPAFY
jgi:hypothetical protein